MTYPSIVYHSLTNNTKKFISKIKYSKYSIELKNDSLIINNKFILSTYTIKFGEVPNIINKFMINNYKNCIGLIGNGNKNWGKELYCNAVNILNKQYNIPILMKYELSGTDEDIEKFNQIYEKIRMQLNE